MDELLSQVHNRYVESKHIDHFDVSSIDEALVLLDENQHAVKVIAGGIDLVRLMKSKIAIPNLLLNIKTIPGLRYIKEDAEGLKVGSLTTINDIETSPVIQKKYTLLAEAAHSVASPQIRNMATIAGNLCQEVNCWYYRMPPLTGRSFFCYRKGGLSCYAIDGDNRYHAIVSGDNCHAVCQSDMASALLALDAKVKLASLTGEIIIPLDEIYSPENTTLMSSSLMVEIQVPTPVYRTHQRYIKFRLRKTIDPAIVSVAAAITTEMEEVTQAKIIIGAIARIPYRSIEAENALIGNKINKTNASIAGELAVSKAIPLSMNKYKLAITKVLVQRAIMG